MSGGDTKSGDIRENELRTNGIRGKLKADAPLAPLVWFKSGGNAEYLFEPADVNDLSLFLQTLDPSVPVMGLGLGSNMIIRDGGVPGVVVRLGKAFSNVKILSHLDGIFEDPPTFVHAGSGAPGISVASAARDAGIAGLEFLRGIPGTAGGAARMNAGAYGREVKDVLHKVILVLRNGDSLVLKGDDLQFSYRHSNLPEGAIVVAAIFRGIPGEPPAIQAEMDRIAAAREESQPLRSRTGGSTFKNPPGHKAWALIDAAGCRGLRRGDAQVSEKHCNFLLNLGNASSSDIEELGEEVRRRVQDKTNITLEWEIQRIGVA